MMMVMMLVIVLTIRPVHMFVLVFIRMRFVFRHNGYRKELASRIEARILPLFGGLIRRLFGYSDGRFTSLSCNIR